MDLSSKDLGKFQSQYHGGNIAFYKDFEREILINIFVTCFDLYCPWLRNWIWTSSIHSDEALHRSVYGFSMNPAMMGFSGTDNDEQSLSQSASVFHLWLLEAFS